MIRMDQNEATLLRQYSPMAKRIAHGFKRRLPASVEADDLLAAAMSGLWDAIRFHPEAGPGFDRYAAVRIRGAVLDELRCQDWLPRRHRAAVEEGSAVRVHVLYDVEESGGGMADPGDLEHDLSKRSIARRLITYLDHLMPRERSVIVAHYFRGEKFRDIGIGMGVSEPRISQIHARAVEKLRAKVPHSFVSAL